MAIVQVIIPDHDIDIPLTELVGVIRDRLVFGPMDGNNRYFAHLEVQMARPSRAGSSRPKSQPDEAHVVRRETCPECGNAYYPHEIPRDCVIDRCPYRDQSQPGASPRQAAGSMREPKPGAEDGIGDKLATPAATEIDFDPAAPNESLDVAAGRAPKDERADFVGAALARRAKFLANGRTVSYEDMEAHALASPRGEQARPLMSEEDLTRACEAAATPTHGWQTPVQCRRCGDVILPLRRRSFAVAVAMRSLSTRHRLEHSTGSVAIPRTIASCRVIQCDWLKEIAHAASKGSALASGLNSLKGQDMTTPNERRRNLGWTRSTLQEVADAAADGSLLRQRARQLLETAPSILDIEGLNTASPDQVSAVINCIEAARELFRTALRELDEPVICRGLKVTLRHYPEPSDFGFWRQLAGRGVPMGSVILNDVEGAVARKRGEVWLAENREPLESSNAFVEAHGLPLARHRKF